MEFSSWLLSNEHDNRIDSLKRDVLHDIADGGMPEVFTPWELRERMEAEAATVSAMETLDQAEAEWRAEGYA